MMTSFLRIFMAQQVPLAFSLTRMTLPKVPLPRSFKQSKSFIVCGKKYQETVVISISPVFSTLHLQSNMLKVNQSAHKLGHRRMVRSTILIFTVYPTNTLYCESLILQVKNSVLTSTALLQLDFYASSYFLSYLQRYDSGCSGFRKLGQCVQQ